MSTTGVTISPVNMADRRDVGIRTGDTVRVWVKVEEKGKTRLQPFEGVVLARKHGSEPGATFTVRRVSGGFGVEKIFPLYSPNIDKIEIVKRAKVRRAKLYHIREKAAREIKRQMRRAQQVSLSTVSDIEEKSIREPQDESKVEVADEETEKKGETPEVVSEEVKDEALSEKNESSTEEKKVEEKTETEEKEKISKER